MASSFRLLDGLTRSQSCVAVVSFVLCACGGKAEERFSDSGRGLGERTESEQEGEELTVTDDLNGGGGSFSESGGTKILDGSSDAVRLAPGEEFVIPIVPLKKVSVVAMLEKTAQTDGPRKSDYVVSGSNKDKVQLALDSAYPERVELEFSDLFAVSECASVNKGIKFTATDFESSMEGLPIEISATGNLLVHLLKEGLFSLKVHGALIFGEEAGCPNGAVLTKTATIDFDIQVLRPVGQSFAGGECWEGTKPQLLAGSRLEGLGARSQSYFYLVDSECGRFLSRNASGDRPFTLGAGQ